MFRISLFISLLFLQTLFALSQVPVNLEECRTEALEYNKSLDAARLDVKYAEAAIKAARTSYLPKIEGSGSMMYIPDLDGFSMPGFFLPTAESTEAAALGNYTGTSDVYFPGFKMNMDDLKLYMAEISAEQPVYAGGRIRLANKKAQLGTDLAKQALNLTRSEVVFGVDQAFWSLVAVQEQVEVMKRYLTALDSLESELTIHYNLGLLARSELLKVTVQRNETRLKLVEVNNMLHLTSMNLALLTGRPLDVLLMAVPRENDKLNVSGISNPLNFSLRPELRILEYQREIAYLDQKSVEGEYLPQIGLSLGYRYIKVPDLVSGKWNLSAGAGISIPIVHWREKKHRTDMARIKWMKSETELKDAQNKMSVEVQQNRFNLDSGLEKVNIAAKNLEQAEETLAEVTISYNVGINSITDLLNAQAAHQRAVASFSESKANLEILKSAYLKSLGVL